MLQLQVKLCKRAILMKQIMYQTGYAFLSKARNKLILRILKIFTYKTCLLY